MLHSRIQGKPLELSVPSHGSDVVVAPGKTWRYGHNPKDWVILSQASLVEEGATTWREWGAQKSGLKIKSSPTGNL